MIGIIQKVLVELLENVGGNELRTKVMERAGVDPATKYRIDQNYSDAECMRLIEASIAETGHSPEEIYTLYAKAFLDEANKLFPRFFQMSENSQAFLQRQAKIHAIMAAGLRGEQAQKRVTDKFEAGLLDNGDMRVFYRSPNRLCGLFEALAVECGNYYNENVIVNCENCAKKTGSDACVFRLNWPEQK
jgi:hypothetical protein